MARPIKEGLDYLPLDVDFFENPKIEAIADEFGCAGECIILRLFCRIYDNGAFIKVDALLTRPISKRTGTSIETVTAVIDRAVEYDIFDRDKYEQFGVLTSKGIQERFLFAKKRSKGVDIPEEFLLVDIDAVFTQKELMQQKPRLNGSYCNINSDSEGVIVNSQKEERKERTKEKKEENKVLKVKESKEKKSKQEKDCLLAQAKEKEKSERASEQAAEEAELFLNTETYSDVVTDLANEIAQRFGLLQAMPIHRQQVMKLINAIHIRGQDTPGKIREALKKLDTAEAITSGKINFGIDQFFYPECFCKLLNGYYDKLRKRDKKTTPDLGVDFEARTEDYYS